MSQFFFVNLQRYLYLRIIMKNLIKNTKWILVASLFFATSAIQAQSTSQLRVKYIEKNIGISATELSKLSPTIKAFVKDIKVAGDIYDNVKSKYKSNLQNNTLNDKQAAELNTAKLASESKICSIKSAYYPKFQKLTSEKVIFKIYKLVSDKKSKFIPGKKKNTEDNE